MSQDTTLLSENTLTTPLQILNKKNCCGCNACGDICNYGAIAYKSDIEGFWYPEIDKKKCTNCGLCEKICPIIHAAELKKNDLEQSICYAAEHKNIEVVFDSTSGGAFSALADIMYKEKGYVGGAVFNEDFSIKHYISNNKKDLPKLRSSKYAESDLSGFYNEIKNLLKNNEKVLVCGCPCQMAALRSFLQKGYDNLIIADFICRGITSPKVLRKYLDTFETRYGSPVVYSKAKSKEYGWRNLTQKIVLANGKSYYETKDINNFTIGYLQTNAFCRPSCYDCQFKGFPRIADITLADYWGIEKLNKTMEKDLGTSLVMINSQKGLAYFEKVKQRLNFVQTPFDSIFQGNPALTKPLNPPLIDRKQFFEDLEKMTFLEVSSKYFRKKRIQIIKNQIKKILRILLNIKQDTRFQIKPLYQLLKYNKIKNILKGNFLLPASYCVIEIKKTANLKINGILRLGVKKFSKSKLETRLLVEKGAMLEVGNDVGFSYGTDIEVFQNATLKISGKSKGNSKDCGANINCTIICAERIEIGKDVQIGRNVTIRDNNGGHYMNRQGYRNSRPVIIGDKVWLCEGCTIMSGVHIGEGAIIGAHALVFSNVPPHTMVTGNPARVIDNDVLWKY
jgi:acetyltransferase-like isoleucine patch superfamily enzyme/coenzyme F420-reducing hydrogenase beta subunit